MKIPQAKASIFVIDDTPANLRLLSQMLRLHDYTVRAMTDGERALTAIALNPPDLILLDIMMPGINGYEVCKRLKSSPQTKGIPVIFLSALDEPMNKVEAFAVGGVDYITKPFYAEEVLARINTHLGLRQLQRRLEQANADLAAQNRELQEALDTIQTLSGLIPICAWCGRKIQDEHGGWATVEKYIETHSEATFTHGICPECLTKFKPGNGK